MHRSLTFCTPLRVTVFFLALAAAPGLAVAQDGTGAIAPRVPQAARSMLDQGILDQAQAAIFANDLARAEQLLGDADENTTDRNQLDFLRGMVALGQRDYKTAQRYFKGLLDRDSSLNRVRLELARAYFLEGDDVAAEHYFRAASAQGLPPEAQANVNKFLTEIRKRKRWEVNVGASVAPDTNINAATTAQSVDLFGLPFELAGGAREKSGVGLTATIAGSYQWDVARGETTQTKLKVGLAYYDTEYANQDFTDRNLNVYAGPRFLLGGRSEVSVLATGARRWYGGKAFNYGAGGRIEAQTELTPRILLNGAVAGQMLYYDYTGYEDYSGPVIAVNTSLLYAFDAHSFARGYGGFVRERAREPGLRNIQYIAGVGYYRDDLPGSFTAYVSVQSTFVRYDAALAAFGAVRRDTALDYRISISNKKIDIFGFSPVISFLHTDRYSNLPLFTYHRNRGEIGVTRNF